MCQMVALIHTVMCLKAKLMVTVVSRIPLQQQQPPPPLIVLSQMLYFLLQSIMFYILLNKRRCHLFLRLDDELMRHRLLNYQTIYLLLLLLLFLFLLLLLFHRQQLLQPPTHCRLHLYLLWNLLEQVLMMLQSAKELLANLVNDSSAIKQMKRLALLPPPLRSAWRRATR